MSDYKKPPPILTLVEHVYYQEDGADPTAAISRWSARLKTQEQPYGRRSVKVDVKPQLLDLGWLETSSQAVIENTGGKVFFIGLMDQPLTTVSPGRSVRLEPTGKLSVWCPEGETTYSITAFPA